MGIGGPARFFTEPLGEAELRGAIAWAGSRKVPFFILGKGSNVVFEDKGYPGLVIHMMRYEQQGLSASSALKQVRASAGIHLLKLARFCESRSLSGSEFLANIPGTVGGALVMNAGFCRHPGQKNEIADLVDSVKVLDQSGEKKVLDREEINFRYRESSLTNFVVLEATFQLWTRDREYIHKEIEANMNYRNAIQDLKYPSSGSAFKNPDPPEKSAGKLIEEAGLKGYRVGGVQISEKHANYVIHTGEGTCRDLKRLLKHVRTVVREKLGVSLEPEIRIIA